jgi:hypothetical protein
MTLDSYSAAGVMSTEVQVYCKYCVSIKYAKYIYDYVNYVCLENEYGHDVESN